MIRTRMYVPFMLYIYAATVHCETIRSAYFTCQNNVILEDSLTTYKMVVRSKAECALRTLEKGNSYFSYTGSKLCIMTSNQYLPQDKLTQSTDSVWCGPNEGGCKFLIADNVYGGGLLIMDVNSGTGSQSLFPGVFIDYPYQLAVIGDTILWTQCIGGVSSVDTDGLYIGYLSGTGSTSVLQQQPSSSIGKPCEYNGVAADAERHIFFVHTYQKGIYAYNKTGSKMWLVTNSTTSASAYPIAVDAKNMYIYWGDANGIYKCRYANLPLTTPIETVSRLSFSVPMMLIFLNSAEQRLYVSVVNSSDGTCRLLSMGLDGTDVQQPLTDLDSSICVKAAAACRGQMFFTYGVNGTNTGGLLTQQYDNGVLTTTKVYENSLTPSAMIQLDPDADLDSNC